MKSLLENSRRILTGGHRGCSCGYQENTLAAMQEGRRRGADYLEIDIQYTADDKIVIYHDTCLEGKGGLHGYVQEHTLEELRAHIEINTLDEVLSWGMKNQIFFGLELKEVPIIMSEKNRRMLPKLIACVKAYKMEEQVFVFGANYQILKSLKSLEKQINIGLIVPFVPADPVLLMKEMDALIYLSYLYNMTPDIVRNLQSHGYYVDGSTVKDEQSMKLAVELGVNMLEVDDPSQWKAFQFNMGEKKEGIECQLY